MSEDPKELSIEEVRARRKALREKSTTRERALAEAKERRDLKDEEAIDALKTRLGESGVRVVEVDSAPPLPGRVAIRLPEDEFDEWQAMQMKLTATPPERLAAQQDLARGVVIYPSIELYDELCEKHHGLFAAVAVAAIEFAGAGARERGKE